MNGQRAVAVLGGLQTNQPAFDADEIEDLIALGLVVEADPDDLEALQWLVPAVREHAKCDLGDPLAAANLMAAYGELDTKLKRDWYRFTTSDEKLAVQERDRAVIKRALGYVNDTTAMTALKKIIGDARALAPGAQYVCHTTLGSELYAVTQKGADVKRQLELRLDRYGEAPLAAFMKAHDKTDAKMRAFSGEISTLAKNIGYVKKNPHQVVIGLAKTGAPATEALNTYRTAMQQTRAPDVAVTCTRNAAAFGSPLDAAAQLTQAQALLYRAGFPRSPVVMGVAKSLLPYQPLETGVTRFRGIVDMLVNLAQGEPALKLAARLMPADGTPREVVERAVRAIELLHQMPSTVNRERPTIPAAVALASMVKDIAALEPLVARFRAIEIELVRQKISWPQVADDDALECVGCPGTPVEVADTVKMLIGQLAPGRDPQRADVAVAVAFAKRFAF